MYKWYLFILFHHCDPYSFKLKEHQKFRIRALKESLMFHFWSPPYSSSSPLPHPGSPCAGTRIVLA